MKHFILFALCLMVLLLFGAAAILSETMMETVTGTIVGVVPNSPTMQVVEQSELIVLIPPSVVFWLLTGKVEGNLRHCILPVLTGIASEDPFLSQRLPFTDVGTEFDYTIHTRILHQNLPHMIAPLDMNEMVVFAIGCFYLVAVVALGKWK